MKSTWLLTLSPPSPPRARCSL
ncbi:hypothetical protein E2C01_080060 [Portunus trituberculatus]|uniref:Uncharacterized protein n=1 Tax=Portunus trituberculatus TaxID=210409 RepID=A0A5B7III4_PORTR|nr:hypothetical protein [Portunus trituberculatus]